MTHLITPEEFIAAYAERGGWTVEHLLDYRVVVPCDCDFELCEGWALVSREIAIDDYGGWVYPEEGSKPADEIWYQKPWQEAARASD